MPDEKRYRPRVREPRFAAVTAGYCGFPSDEFARLRARLPDPAIAIAVARERNIRICLVVAAEKSVVRRFADYAVTSRALPVELSTVSVVAYVGP